MPSHTNFYRKYRPVTFAEIIGQEKVVSILKNTIMQNKLHHAYLFSGSQGVGKTSTARILACAANCLENKLGEMCQKCESCQNNQKFFHDIIEIDAASHNGVDQIRSLQEQSMIMPATSRYKIFIIDEVHMLSKSAFNAFLKILEEPPKHVLFILATTEINKIPATILSRCHRFHFQRVSLKAMEVFLQKVAKKELLSFDRQALTTIANYSQGCVRDALNVLEQIAFSNLNHQIAASDVINYFGFLDQKTQIYFLNLLFLQEKNNVEKMISNFTKSGINFANLTMHLLELLKNQLFYKINNQPLTVELVEISSLKVINTQELQKVIDIIFHTFAYFRYQMKPQLIFEIMCLNILVLLQKPSSKTDSKSLSYSSTTTSASTIVKTSSIFLDKNPCQIHINDLLKVLHEKKLHLFSTIKVR